MKKLLDKSHKLRYTSTYQKTTRSSTPNAKLSMSMHSHISESLSDKILNDINCHGSHADYVESIVTEAVKVARFAVQLQEGDFKEDIKGASAILLETAIKHVYSL